MTRRHARPSPFELFERLLQPGLERLLRWLDEAEHRPERRSQRGRQHQWLRRMPARLHGQQREQADARWKQLIAELRQRTPVRIDESHYAPTRGSGEKPRAG